MRHMSSAWPEVVSQLRLTKHIMLLSDYDGTLTPIVERPELADLHPKTGGLLQKLGHCHNLTVGIISGRALSDLKSRVGLEGITYAGNHGLEIEGPGLSFVDPFAQEVKPLLRLLHLALLRAVSAIKGVFVENKGLTLSLHYRQVEDSQSKKVKSTFERVVALSRAVGKVRTTKGKKVYEIMPAVDWDKGRAIELLLERHRRGVKREPLLVFLGDDLTDEDGFKVVKKEGGISIFVGDEGSKSQANYFLHSPVEVEKFLELLLEPKMRVDYGLA